MPEAALAIQTQRLMASDGAADDEFGYALAVDGTRAVVGAFRDDTDTRTSTGSAYVFELVDGDWTQTAQLHRLNPGTDDRFGFSVALDGDRALVGALGVDPPSGFDGGAVFVFEQSGGTWRQTAMLQGRATGTLDQFGYSLSLDGDRALIGAPQENSAGRIRTGAAYVYELQGGTWVEAARLEAADAESDDEFGSAVALRGERALIGAPGITTRYAGAAYVFERDGGTWSQTARLESSDNSGFDLFGSSVAVSGRRVLIGAEFDRTGAGEKAGSAYVFEYGGAKWEQTAKLTAPNGAPLDLFGASVSLDGPRALVGAPFRDAENPVQEDVGAAYVFALSGGAWIPAAVLRATDGDESDRFGTSVALVGSRAFVGAPEWRQFFPPGTEPGAVYTFGLSRCEYLFSAYLTSPASLPDSGGAFRLRFEIDNTANRDAASVDIWTRVRRADGTGGTFVRPPGSAAVVPAGEARSEAFVQDVPASLESGTFLYTIFAGQYNADPGRTRVCGSETFEIVKGVASRPRPEASGAAAQVADGPRHEPAAASGGYGAAPTPPAVRVHPNPAGRSATFTFSLERGGPIDLVLYDARGREAMTVAAGWYPAGEHVARPSRALPPGVYVWRLHAHGRVEAGLLTVAR